MKNLRSVTLTLCLATLGSLSLHAQYVPVWNGGSSFSDSVMYQTGGDLGVNTTSPKWALDVTGHINSSAGYLIGENLVLTMPGGANQYNTALGLGALNPQTSGSGNVAVGYISLSANTAGSYNTAIGASAMQNNQSGPNNTAVGWGALGGLETGTNNIAVGYNAGAYLLIGNNNNIDIGNFGGNPGGPSSDNGVIRIGTGGTQTSFFAAGISGVNISGAPVLVSSTGQLGIGTSSRRFKEDIHDMGDASSALMRLRPVTFRYKQAYEDGSRPVDYGLIAEEVAEVYPDLAVMGADGQIQTIQYQKLTPMLLNEVQKQHQLIEQQAETISLLQKRLEALETSLHAAR